MPLSLHLYIEQKKIEIPQVRTIYNILAGSSICVTCGKTLGYKSFSQELLGIEKMPVYIRVIHFF